MLQERIPGHFLGTSLNEAVHLVEHLLVSSPPSPRVEPISEPYQQALVHYSQRRPLIDVAVWEALQGTDISEDHLRLADHDLSRSIIAALAMGDMDLLSSHLDWVKNLQVNQQVSTAAFCAYLNAYHQAVETELGEKGIPIKTWLAHVMANCEQVQV